MKLKQITLVCAVLVLVMFTLGCAKPPTEEMNKATEAVTLAENDIDAVTYAGNSITRAREALTRMQTEAASKRYDAAKSSAAEAISAAERAITEGRNAAARARQEASTLVSELKPLIEETQQGVNAAKAAELPLDFDTIDRDFDSACLKAEQAQAALSGGRYQDALEQGRTARAELTGINQQISSMAIASSRKK